MQLPSKRSGQNELQKLHRTPAANLQDLKTRNYVPNIGTHSTYWQFGWITIMNPIALG
jgi:predicted nicotinamide N-methyase